MQGSNILTLYWLYFLE